MDSERVAMIMRGVLWLGRRLRAERPPGGVSLSAIGILGTLFRLGPMPAARLAEVEKLQPQSLTRLIGGLERDGCIERTRSATDRREIVIALTAHGRQVLIDDMRGRRLWLERAIAERLSDTEREILLAAAAIMLKLAEQEPGQAPPSTAPHDRED